MPKKVALTSGLRAAERSSAMAKVVEKTRSARAAVFSGPKVSLSTKKPW